jgi:LacI family repressor for deo operon, udp, cdd, tsx, nupC, and nupG
MATIKEVALRAGVTPTTVTNVIRGKGRVGDETRERVLAAIAAEKYRPNLNARALVERKAPTLALMVSCITNPFYPEFTLQAHLAARKNGRFLLICNTEHEEDGGQQFLHDVAGSLSDGVLIANRGDLNIPQLKTLADSGMPVVVSVWEFPDRHPGIPCVGFDSRKAGQLATEHLLALGHKKIGAIIASELDGIHGGRYEGFCRALAAAGSPLLPENLLLCVDSFEDGYATAHRYLAGKPDITALFVSNDLPALAVLDAASDLGIRVPQDLSIVSITNIQSSAQARPGLTTVAIPTTAMAARGIEMLLGLLEHTPEEPPMECIDTLELVVRQSTAPPAKS